MTTLDWPAILLAEAERGDAARQQADAIKDKAKRAEAMQAAEHVFPDALCLWADWLEDQGDPACQGVRELLVGQKRRPLVVWNDAGDAVSAAWFSSCAGNRHEITLDVLKRLTMATKHRGMYVIYMSACGDEGTVVRTALYDAARAWAGKGKAVNTKE